MPPPNTGSEVVEVPGFAVIDLSNEIATTDVAYKITSTGIIFTTNTLLPLEQYIGLGRRLSGHDKSIQWCIGDWLNYGAERKGWGQKYKEAIKATGYDYQSLRDLAYVCKRVKLSRRRENLSFEHHRAVAKLDDAGQNKWLNRISKAQDEGNLIPARVLAKSILAGKLLTSHQVAKLNEDHSTKTHIPWVNALTASLGKLRHGSWMKEANPQQRRRMCEDLQPIVDFYDEISDCPTPWVNRLTPALIRLDLASMTSAERRALKQEVTPIFEFYRTQQHDEPMVPLTFEEWTKSPDGIAATHQRFRRVLGELLAAKNSKMACEVFMLALGMHDDGVTEVSLAKRYCCTRANVSKMCVQFTERLGLRPSSAMRPLPTQKACAEAQRRIRENAVTENTSTSLTHKIVPMDPANKITPTGIVFSQERPLTVDQYFSLGMQLSGLGKSIQWCLGDWMNYGTERKDRGRKYQEAIKATGYNYQSLLDLAYTCKHVDLSRRRENLSFEHHRVVAKLEDTEQYKWLALAAKAHAEGKPISAQDFAKSIKAGKLLYPSKTESLNENRGSPNHIIFAKGLMVSLGWFKRSQWLEEAGPEQRRVVREDLESIIEFYDEISVSPIPLVKRLVAELGRLDSKTEILVGQRHLNQKLQPVIEFYQKL